MKIVLELFGASRDFSEKGHIDFEIQKLLKREGSKSEPMEPCLRIQKGQFTK